MDVGKLRVVRVWEVTPHIIYSIYIYLHVYIYIFLHVYTYIYLQVYIYIYLFVNTRICTHQGVFGWEIWGNQSSEQQAGWGIIVHRIYREKGMGKEWCTSPIHFFLFN